MVQRRLSMRSKRFTETQIIRILKEVEGGRTAREVCREYEISEATYFNWKSKYGGMEASDVRKLKDVVAKKLSIQSRSVPSSSTSYLIMA